MEIYTNYLILIIGFLFHLKIMYWHEMLRNKFRTGAPYFFMGNPGTYVAIDIIVFALLLIFLEIDWYIILITYIIASIVGVYLSEKERIHMLSGDKNKITSMKKILINIIHIFEILTALCLLYSIWYLADKLPSILLGLYILIGIPLIAVGIYTITSFLQHLIIKEKK